MVTKKKRKQSPTTSTRRSPSRMVKDEQDKCGLHITLQGCTDDVATHGFGYIARPHIHAVS